MENIPRPLLGINEWRAWFLSDYERAWAALTELHGTDSARFLDVCRVLAADEDILVAEAGLRQLGFRGARNDVEADRIARVQLQHGDPALQNAALLALGRVGIPGAFTFLEPFVTPDSHIALLAFASQARGAEQRAHVVDIARKLLFSLRGQVRIAAVRILRGFSSVIQEQELLARAAKLYLDETTFAALRHADARVLPELRELQAQLHAGSAQWEDVTTAIAAIERRQ